MTDASTWHPAFSPPTLLSGEIHVWRFDLTPTECELARFERSLHDDERCRAARFRTETLRRRFTAGRGGLRAVLGAYLECPPDGVTLTYGTHGKPALADPVGSGPIAFNLTHTHDLALCAVTPGRTVGVDVEAVRPMEDAERIIRRFFSPREQADFLALPAPERLAAFFRGWSRKEAFLKATGTGLATVLDSFDVTLDPDRPAALLRVGDDPTEAARWSLLDLNVGDGYAAAVAVSGPAGRDALRLWRGLPPAHS